METRAGSLIETITRGVEFPVAVFGHDHRLVAILPTVNFTVLARMQKNVVAIDPPRGEHLISWIFLVADRVKRGDKPRIHLRLVERQLPGNDARVITVSAN